MAARGKTRLLAYRELVHNRIANVVQDWMPGTTGRLARLRPGWLRSEVVAWIGTTGPRSPYLREVPAEFLTWAAPRWEADTTLPAYLVELARFEVRLHDVRNDPSPVVPATDIKLELNAAAVMEPTARVMTFSHGVHRLDLTEGADLEVAPTEGPSHVAVFRNDVGRPYFMELSPREAALVRRLLDGQTLQEALFGACADVGEELGDAMLSESALLLAKMGDRGLLKGG